MRVLRAHHLALLCLVAGCSSESSTTPFVLTIEPRPDDGLMRGPVLQSAVRQVEINIAPSRLSDNFALEPEQGYAPGELETELSPTHSFVIRLTQEWVERNALPGMSTFKLEVPLYSVGISKPDAPAPTVMTTFLRNGERIAEGSANLPWPLPEGGTGLVVVKCRDSFNLKCMDNDSNDPTLGGDAGM